MHRIKELQKALVQAQIIKFHFGETMKLKKEMGPTLQFTTYNQLTPRSIYLEMLVFILAVIRNIFALMEKKDF